MIIQEACDAIEDIKIPRQLTVYNFLDKRIEGVPGDHIKLDGIFQPMRTKNYRRTGELSWYLGIISQLRKDKFLS